MKIRQCSSGRNKPPSKFREQGLSSPHTLPPRATNAKSFGYWSSQKTTKILRTSPRTQTCTIHSLCRPQVLSYYRLCRLKVYLVIAAVLSVAAQNSIPGIEHHFSAVHVREIVYEKTVNQEYLRVNLCIHSESSL
jgi:hypothetical protein